MRLFSGALNCVGYGMCIWDDTGNFVMPKTMWSDHVCSSNIREAFGLSHAIHWMHDLLH
jgi:hypothetical protein